MEMITENEVIDVLKQCFDPEIPVDLWSLGLIYSIKISENSSGGCSAIRQRVGLIR